MTRKQHEEIVRSLKERNRELERENERLSIKLNSIEALLAQAKANIDLILSAINKDKCKP